MDDRDFFDELYAGWARTTGGEATYWQPVEYEDHSGRWRIYAVAEDQTRKLIASEMRSEDAAFITALHGCFADLTRRLNEAVDEADRLDLELDQTIGRVAVLEQEADQANSEIMAAYKKIEKLEGGA